MSERLYYRDSFLYQFDAEVLDLVSVSDSDPRAAATLDRTAFYPTSGGQVFDTGWILPAETGDESNRSRVAEVIETDDGQILHILENAGAIQKGSRIHGLIDVDRRRDHMQQHSGQHVLSAAFLRLFNLPTVSFHMGAESCSIDLDAKNLNTAQVEAAEALANDVVMENRAVGVRFVTQEEAGRLGLRKIPPVERDQLRLVDVHDFDLTACGGTHVSATGEIGCVLLRKTEKTRQGWRVEFVCGKRAVAKARRAYGTHPADHRRRRRRQRPDRDPRPLRRGPAERRPAADPARRRRRERRGQRRPAPARPARGREPDPRRRPGRLAGRKYYPKA